MRGATNIRRTTSTTRSRRSIAQKLKLRRFENDMVLEGGSIDVNGEGLLLTSEQCLLNKNRNPHLTRAADRDRICATISA